MRKNMEIHGSTITGIFKFNQFPGDYTVAQMTVSNHLRTANNSCRRVPSHEFHDVHNLLESTTFTAMWAKDKSTWENTGKVDIRIPASEPTLHKKKIIIHDSNLLTLLTGNRISCLSSQQTEHRYPHTHKVSKKREMTRCLKRLWHRRYPILSTTQTKALCGRLLYICLLGYNHGTGVSGTRCPLNPRKM